MAFLDADGGGEVRIAVGRGGSLARRRPALRDRKSAEEAARRLSAARIMAAAAMREVEDVPDGIDEKTAELMAIAAERLAAAGGDVDAEMAALEAMGVDHERFDALRNAGFEALREMASGKAVFPLSDWEKGVLKKVGKEWREHPQWGAIRRLIAGRTGLVPISDKSGDSPWSLHTFERMLEMEEEMMTLAGREYEPGWGIPQEMIDAAFAARPTMAEEQKLAVLCSCQGNKAVVVTEGTAGAGKSFSLNAVREIYQNAPARDAKEGVGYDILGTALSWSAAGVLKASAGLPASVAIDKLVSDIERARDAGEQFFKRRTLLIVDEAGLVGTEHMLKLLKYAAESSNPVRVVLTGDSLQLAPVAAGNALEAIVEQYGSARLDTIRRQKQDSHRKAVKHFCFGRAGQGLWTFLQQEAIHFCSNQKERFDRVVSDYLSYSLANPTKQALALALSNSDVKHLNMAIRDAMKKAGRVVPPEFALTVTDGREVFQAKFAPGDQIVFRKNVPTQPVFKSEFAKTYEAFDKDKRAAARKAGKSLFGSLLASTGFGARVDVKEREGIFNRMGGVILSIKESRRKPGTYDIRVLLGEGGEVEINTGDFYDEKAKAIPLHHNFATTVYASQGQTVERVLIMDSPQMARRLAYVGMSRHTELCDIYVDKEEVEARIAKKIEKAKEGVWKKFVRERKAARENAEAAREILEKRDVMAKEVEAGKTEHESVVTLKRELMELDEETRRRLKPTDYVRAMAESWAKDSPNMTAFIARKRIAERKGKSDEDMFSPFRAREDDPDDHPEPRHERPPGFGRVERQAAAIREKEREEELALGGSLLRAFERHGGGVTEGGVEVPGMGRLDARLGEELSPMGRGDLEEKTKGVLWTENRFGEQRILARDIDGEVVSRYSTGGSLVAGDGQIPVFPNEDAHLERRECPVLMVRGAAEAAVVWEKMRRELGGTPEHIPHIAVGFAEADWSTLGDWVANFRDKARVYVGWKPGDEGSVRWAIESRERLMGLGYTVGFYPKAPTGGLESLLDGGGGRPPRP